MTRVEMYPGWPEPVGRGAAPGMRRKAEAVLSYAVATAPVDTGEYKSKINMEQLPGGGWRITASAPHSIYVEFGTRYMAAYHTLAVALDAAKG